MAASKARLGYGSKFYTGDTASPIGYTLLSEIAIINFADYTVAEVDVTHLLSPNTSEESIPGLLKPGTIERTGNYSGDASQQNTDALAVAQTVFPWKITAPASGALVLTFSHPGQANTSQAQTRHWPGLHAPRYVSSAMRGKNRALLAGIACTTS